MIKNQVGSKIEENLVGKNEFIFAFGQMDSSNMEIEDIQLGIQERLLDSQTVLKLCTPPITLSFKPIEKNGRFHYTIRRTNHRKQQCQT